MSLNVVVVVVVVVCVCVCVCLPPTFERCCHEHYLFYARSTKRERKKLIKKITIFRLLYLCV